MLLAASPVEANDGLDATMWNICRISLTEIGIVNAGKAYTDGLGVGCGSVTNG